MRLSIRFIVATVALQGLTALAVTPEQEGVFVESYRTALVAGDEKALAAFLHTAGAEADTVADFQKVQMVESRDPNSRVVAVALVTPTAEEAKLFNESTQLANGRKYKLPVTPFKMLTIKREQKDGSGSSTSSFPVAEINGKLVIPIPVPVK